MTKNISLVFSSIVLLFFLSLIVFSNKEQNKISEREKRMLANPPTAKIMSKEYKLQFNAWLEDNVFERDFFINLRSYINSNVFHLKPISTDVEYGKNGWLFFRLDNNIEIAKGKYSLNLEKIARNQQAISDYYNSIGKKYILLIHPSKVSIYPEYLYGNYSIRETPCDLIYNYLRNNTTVNVIDLKSYLLSRKQEGLLCWPGDTHYTPLGSYYVYCAIADFFNIPPKTVDFSIEQRNLGDLRLMLGLTGPSDLQKDFVFNYNSKELSAGDYYEKVKKAVIDSYGDDGIDYKFSMYENATGKNKILIYGDSQFQPQQRKIPILLCEHFGEVGYIWNYFSTETIDTTTDADIVLHAISERASCLLELDVPDYIQKFLSQELPNNEKNISPAEYETELPNYKVFINKDFAYNFDEKIFDSSHLYLNGWSHCGNDDIEVLIEADGKYYKTKKKIYKKVIQ